MTEPLSSFNADGVQWAWDSTSLKLAETCPRKYQYELVEGWVSPFLSVHLWFGALYASALENYHKLCADGIAPEKALQIIIRDTLVESWDHDLDDEGARIPGTGSARLFEHNSKSRETLIRTIIWYFSFFEKDHYETYITEKGEAAVEHSFRLPVDNGVVFCGHIDRLCTDPQREIFVHDQKTTGQTLSQYYFKQFNPDIQFSMYTFAGKMVYNVPVKGVVIDAAQIAVGFTRYARVPTYRTDDQLNEWYDEMMLLIEQNKRYAAAKFFPRNTASCNNFGGCQFRDVCSRPHQVREQFLKADFKQKPVDERWNPIKER